MEMTISAVMVGASSQPQSKASETGFSDILTEVRSAAPQTAENTVNQPSYDAARDYQADAVSAQETEITAEIEETVMTELKNTVISMVSKANGGNAEENDRIISALLDILKKMNDDSEEDPVMNLVMELLASMTGDTADSDMFTLNLNVSEINRTETTEITAILGTETTVEAASADVYKAPDVQPQTPVSETGIQPEQTAEFAQMVDNVADATAEMPVQTADVQQTATAEVPVQTAQPVQMAETQQEPDYNGLLKDILSAAREELGLTKAELTAKPAQAPVTAQEAPVQTEVQPAAQQTAFNMAFNRKDGTDELNSILGLNTEETAAQDDGQEIKAVSAAQDNSAVFAGNVPQKTEVVTADAEVRVEAPLPEQQIADEILTKPEVFEGGRTEFTMELNPESLGRITVRLVSTEGRVEVNISAENDATRQLLESRAENIGQALRSNGVELERYQVVSGQEEAMLMQESYDGSSRNPYGRNDEEQPQEESDEDFLEILQQL
ncbi:MAG: flagellar hook-length control protein FliK [Ruminiclostridium sp.]|nr:flagellar hook-length control protein FliK [Ruminiclostridium sp.]